MYLIFLFLLKLHKGEEVVVGGGGGGGGMLNIWTQTITSLQIPHPVVMLVILHYDQGFYGH